jgi:PIN domain nuclease of toxin-antitoxin system
MIGERVVPLGITLLPIDVTHVARLQALPFHHRDPFDRMLAAQALVEGLTLVSADSAFDAYGMPRVW